MEFIKYNPKLVAYAKKNRKNLTFGEARLWKYLKSKQLGYDFHRQKPIDKFIADFYCPALKLVIEIDGASHNEAKYNYDVKRQKILESLGLTVIRFTENEVLINLDFVLDTISNFAENVSS